jgi:hypothetical protein
LVSQIAGVGDWRGKATLTALIDALRKRGYAFGSIPTYDK